MNKVELGKSVTVHYTGRLEDGTVFDSSLNEGREPLRAILGQGNLIPGFEKGILDSNVGDKVTVEIEPSEAYGEYLDGLVTTLERSRFPEGINIGDVLQSESERGVMVVTVTNITEEGVTIDANHPMAGKKLIFDIEILNVE